VFFFFFFFSLSLQEGFGLAWNPNRHGQLLSASDDHLVCLWNVEGARESTLDAHTVFQVHLLLSVWLLFHVVFVRQGHGDVVEEVDWHRHHECLFGSVGDDRKLMIWDTRHDSRSPIYQVFLS
jgi:histone-binding protein RBBP4